MLSRTPTARSRQLFLGSVRRDFFGTGLRRFCVRSAGVAFLAAFLRGVFFAAALRIDFFGAALLAATFLRGGRLAAFFFFFSAGFF